MRKLSWERVIKGKSKALCAYLYPTARENWQPMYKAILADKVVRCTYV